MNKLCTHTWAKKDPNVADSQGLTTLRSVIYLKSF
jgi:hypothetical protein